MSSFKEIERIEQDKDALHREAEVLRYHHHLWGSPAWVTPRDNLLLRIDSQFSDRCVVAFQAICLVLPSCDSFLIRA